MALFQSPLPKEVFTEFLGPAAKEAAKEISHEIHEAYETHRPSVMRNDCDALAKRFGQGLRQARKEHIPEAELAGPIANVRGAIDVITSAPKKVSLSNRLSSLLSLSRGRAKIRQGNDLIQRIRQDHSMLNEAKSWELGDASTAQASSSQETKGRVSFNDGVMKRKVRPQDVATAPVATAHHRTKTSATVGEDKAETSQAKTGFKNEHADSRKLAYTLQHGQTAAHPRPSAVQSTLRSGTLQYMDNLVPISFVRYDNGDVLPIYDVNQLRVLQAQR